MRVVAWMAMALIAAVAGCSTLQTSYDFDRGANFSGLHTYRWVQPIDAKVDSISDTRIKNAVNNTLTSKGYSEKLSGDVDFLVGYRKKIEHKKELVTTATTYSYPYSYYRGYYPVYWTTDWQTREFQWDEGTLVLDILDGGGKSVIWQGHAQAELDHSRTPQQREQLVNMAVNQMLAGFPPK